MELAEGDGPPNEQSMPLLTREDVSRRSLGLAELEPQWVGLIITPFEAFPTDFSIPWSVSQFSLLPEGWGWGD